MIETQMLMRVFQLMLFGLWKGNWNKIFWPWLKQLLFVFFGMKEKTSRQYRFRTKICFVKRKRLELQSFLSFIFLCAFDRNFVSVQGKKVFHSFLSFQLFTGNGNFGLCYTDPGIRPFIVYKMQWDIFAHIPSFFALTLDRDHESHVTEQIQNKIVKMGTFKFSSTHTIHEATYLRYYSFLSMFTNLDLRNEWVMMSHEENWIIDSFSIFRNRLMGILYDWK